MPTDAQGAVFSETVGQLLPYLRRYARALTGSQTTGDNYAAATLEAMLEDPSIIQRDLSTKVALFRAFHMIWKSAGAPVEEAESGIAERAQARLSNLTPDTREALLLSTIEEFTAPEIASIMSIEATEVEHLISVAQREMEESIRGRILVIEDEPIIALDLQTIVTDMGHSVTGVARTHKGAVEQALRERPDLILSDIQLADGSSGIEAVNEILTSASDIPVIFITAYPERLLTGDRPEPAFVITKPYSEAQVQSAVSQAMFFSSTETLQA